MRITKINKIPHQFIFSENGIELSGPRIPPNKSENYSKILKAQKE